MRYASLLALVFPCCLWSPWVRGQQPDLWVCSSPGLSIDAGTPVVQDTISIADDESIIDLQILLDVSHPSVGELIVDVTSPAGTTVRLHDGAGAGIADLLLTFSDGGIPNAPPYDCTCLMQPSGPGVLADFSSESIQGDWLLQIQDASPATLDGILNAWCVRAFLPPPLAAVEGLSCVSVAGSGVAEVGWRNTSYYEEVRIYVGGTLAATFPGPFTSGNIESVTIPIEAGPHEVCVEGVDGGEAAPQVCRQVLPVGAAEIMACSHETVPIPAGSSSVTSTITIPGASLIADVQIVIDITVLDLGSLSILLEHGGTAVPLQAPPILIDQGEIYLLYTSDGWPNGSGTFGCGCPMQTNPPGALEEFAQMPTAGDWNLEVVSTSTPGVTLNNWCVRVVESCALDPPVGLSCNETGAAVLLEWENGDDYDSIDVVRNGNVVAILFGPFAAGSAGIFVDNLSTPCSYTYSVIGRSSALACGSASEPCTIGFGLALTDVIFAGDTGGPNCVYSAQALKSALEAGCRQVEVVTELTHAAIEVPARVWVMLGSYPNNHTLTEEEGQVLAELNTGDLGLDGFADQEPLPVYIEGDDVWGFDPQTTFAYYDGVGPASDGNDTCVLLFGTSFAGPAHSLDLTGLDAPHFCVDSWVDQLTPATLDLGGPAAGTVWTCGDGFVPPYPTGIFYDSTFAPVISSSTRFGSYGGDQALLAGLYLDALGEIPTEDPFLRGDFNRDGALDLADAISILQFLFVDGAAPDCPDAADTNDDGTLAIDDAIVLLATLFAAGPPLPPPGPDACAPDPTVDTLGLCAYPGSSCP